MSFTTSAASRGIRGSRCRLRRVGERPFQGVVGNFLPAFLCGEKVRPALVHFDLGDGVRLVMLGIRPLDARRHEVVARLPQQRRLDLERRDLAQLAPARVRARGGRRRAGRGHASLRPTSLLRVAPAPGRSHGRRGRTAGGPLANDDPLDLRPSLRRARRHRNALGRGRDQARTRGRPRLAYRFVPATDSGATRPEGESPANPGKPTPGLEPGTPSLRVSVRCHHQSPGVTSGHVSAQSTGLEMTHDDPR
jgi:hypothetical protein